MRPPRPLHLAAALMVAGLVGPRPSAAQQEAALASGARLAFACDEALHDELTEFAGCIEGQRARLPADPAARAGFWFGAWLRAEAATRNGYADAAPFAQRYAQAARQAVREASLAREALCEAALQRCDALPQPLPMDAAPGRAESPGRTRRRVEEPAPRRD